MAITKGRPFVFKGVTDVQHCKTSHEVMVAAGLDWEVGKCEITAKMPFLQSLNDTQDGFVKDDSYYRDIKNSYAIYRTDNCCPLGVVKGKYTEVKNIEAFAFFDDAIGKNNAIWQTAGCFGNGERIFVSAKLPSMNMVNGFDPVENYLVFTNTHDSSGGVKILFSPIRVICENTLNAAIKTAKNYVSFRHTKSVHDKIGMAHTVLGIAKHMSVDLGLMYDEMYKTPMKDTEAYDVFASVILTANEILAVKETGHTMSQIIARDYSAITDANISMKKVNVISQINQYYNDGIGQREIIGTGWGVYNAITGFYSNVDNAEGLKRMDSLLYGDKSKKIQTAGDLILG